MATTTLTEHVADWSAGLTVERENRLVRNVALSGQQSRNGYRYAEEALTAAVPLYDQKPVFLDHAADRARPQERSTRDLVGTVVNPRFEAGRIRGDIRVLDTESGRTFLALVAEEAPGVGMSHVVLAERSADGATVERIRDVVSVDAVVGPATTRTFRETSMAQGPSSIASLSDGEPTMDHGPLSTDHEQLTPHEKRDEIELLHEELAGLRAERDELRQQLQRIEEQARTRECRRRLHALLSEAGLPEFARTEPFLRQLEAAVDDAARRELVRERVALVARAARTGPFSAEREAGHNRAVETARFVAAIRRR